MHHSDLMIQTCLKLVIWEWQLRKVELKCRFGWVTVSKCNGSIRQSLQPHCFWGIIWKKWLKKNSVGLAFLHSPLIFFAATLTNTEVISINQDQLVMQGRRLRTGEDQSVWVSSPSVVLIFDRSRFANYMITLWQSQWSISKILHKLSSLCGKSFLSSLLTLSRGMISWGK